MSQELIAYSAPYPLCLPEATREMLYAYDVATDPQEASEARSLAESLALDIEYLDGRPERRDDQHLHAIRQEQAQYLQPLIERTGTVIRSNTFYLGALLIEAERRYLYTYLGHRSLDAWCENLNIDSSTLKEAKQVVALWHWLRQFGYSVQDVVAPIEGQITKEKIRLLQQLSTAKKYERENQTIEVYTEHYGPLPAGEETGKPKSVARLVKRAIDLLPEEEQEEIQEEIQDRYIAEMREHIDHIRVQPIEALNAEQHELQGLISKPIFHLQCIRRGKEIVFHGSLFCGEAEAHSLVAGLYGLILHVPGHDGMTVSAFGEHLLQEGWPDDDE